MREQIDGWVDRQKENIIEMYQFLHNNAEIRLLYTLEVNS